MHFLIVGIANFTSTNASATCPIWIHPVYGETGYSPWTTPFPPATYWIGSCQFQVKYCKRFVLGKWQYYLDEVIKIGGSGCNSMKWSDIINTITDKLLKDPSVLPCGQGITAVVQVYRGSCIKFIYNDGNPIAQGCGETYCQKECEVCTDPISGLPVTSNCVSSVVTTPGSAVCEYVEDIDDVTYGDTAAIDNPWAVSVCFLMGCFPE